MRAWRRAVSCAQVGAGAIRSSITSLTGRVSPSKRTGVDIDEDAGAGAGAEAAEAAEAAAVETGTAPRAEATTEYGAGAVGEKAT